MREGGQTQGLESLGDARSGALLLLAGAALLGSTLTGVWSGPVVVPTALAIALLVFGLWLAGLRLAGRLTGATAPDRRIDFFEGHPEPVFVTSLDGAVLARNPAAPATGFLEGVLADPSAAIYRLTREARATGIAEEEAGPNGGRVLVTRLGPRSLLWRLERPGGRRHPAVANLADTSVPWVRAGADGRVTALNAAAASGLPQPLETLDAALVDPPLRADGIHILAGSGQPVRAVVLPGPDGQRDALFVPLAGDEIAGLVPDHFLEELPVALTRLETDGRLIYANRAARQLLGERAEPGVNITDLIEGLGRSIRERLADTIQGPRARPLRGRPRHRRRPGDLPAGRLHPHRARRRALGSRGALRRHRTEDARSPVRPVPEDAGGRASSPAAWRTTSTTC